MTARAALGALAAVALALLLRADGAGPAPEATADRGQTAGVVQVQPAALAPAPHRAGAPAAEQTADTGLLPGAGALPALSPSASVIRTSAGPTAGGRSQASPFARGPPGPAL